MKLRHNPEHVNACHCPCHEPGLGYKDDDACEDCGVLICPTCTQVVPQRLVLTVMALEDARRDG